jgi:hypothetical protein
MAHVRTNHARLVRAALTILRAYVLAGRPNVGVGTWGSFEGWAGLVPSAVAFSGLPDAGLTRATLSVRIGADDAVLVDLVEGWYELCQSVELKGIGATAAQAIRLLSTHPQKFVRLRDAVAEASSNASSSGPTARQVGYLLRKYRGRVVNGRRIVARTQKDRACWSIEELQTAMPAEVALPIRDGGDGGDGGDGDGGDGHEDGCDRGATPFAESAAASPSSADGSSSAGDYKDPPRLSLYEFHAQRCGTRNAGNSVNE